MARNRVAANMLMIMVLLAGLFGMTTIKQEVFPEFTLDMVTVTVAYPGAAPEEVEQSIVLALEEAIQPVQGVKRLNSTAAENVASVVAELSTSVDPNSVLMDIKTAVDRIQSMPLAAERPQVQLAINKSEVVSIVISGDQSTHTLEAEAERIRQAMLTSGRISQAEVQGVPPHELAIEIDREQLDGLGVTLGDISDRVAAASRDFAGGSLETSRGEILLRVADRKVDANQFAGIVIASNAKGSEVTLGEVATITNGYALNHQQSYYNGQPAVRVMAYRTGEESTTSVSDAVHEILEQQRPLTSSAIELNIWNDNSQMLRGRIDLLMRNAKLGLLLVVALLAIFLEARLAFWVAMGIPISFLGAFTVMPAAEISINMISLFALIITLGLVVDDAIVVGEAAYAKMEEGMDRVEAAISGAFEMAMPVTFAILTTIAAFSPLFFVPGMMGKFFRLLPGVVVAVLLFSLIEAFFILPAHLSHKPKSSNVVLRTIDKPRQWITPKLKAFIAGPYNRLVRLLVSWRYATFAGALALFFISVGLVQGGLVPFNFFPKLEGDKITVNARLPYGVSPAETERLRGVLEESLNGTIDHFGADTINGVFTRVGESAGEQMSSGPSVSPNLLSIEVSLVESSNRDYNALDFSAYWNQTTAEYPGLESLSFGSSVGPGAAAAVAIRLFHSDPAVIAEASASFTDSLKQFNDLTDIDNTYIAGKPRYDFRLDPAYQSLGLTSAAVGQQVRGAFYGVEALREQYGRHERRVMVRHPLSEKSSLWDLAQTKIRTPQGHLVPLSMVANVEQGRSPAAITRRDGQRTVDLTAELALDVPSPTPVLNSITKEVLPALMEQYPGLGWSLVGQQEDQKESFAALGRGYLIALVAIFTLLAIPFRSYIQPLIVMSAIPFGFVGAVGGHLLLGYELSIISMFGVIALSGVVVNDSLVLIDAANRFREQGMSHFEAIIAAGRRRFRPILLTSLTTFLGLMPMIFETSVQARFLVPMAISLGFGVLFATVVVLLVVPALYMIADDVSMMPGRLTQLIVRR